MLKCYGFFHWDFVFLNLFIILCFVFFISCLFGSGYAGLGISIY
ncbi:hypothetical protein KsCSTR_35310 [Candidatus Kuenenia stuttgartiensis]|uniref:Uncharacterized protein n=1 Tax=Kuenenia stuttgartiensis TaxID=174633 RepID=A0A6G7GTH2_KUEST|nr:hypothetical protein KsCSTR_35310 [Candidatus Kuenenia stuttgartiensis]